MECKRCQKYLSDYRAGTLDPVLHDWVDQHLSTCPDCREALRKEESISQFLRMIEPPEESGSVADVLMKQLDVIEETRKRSLTDSFSKLSPWTRWILASGMIVVFVVIGWIVFKINPDQSHFRPSFGDVGYIWLDPSGAGTSPPGDTGLMGLGAITGADLPENDDGADGRIVHTFDLSKKEEKTMKSEIKQEETPE